MSRTMEDFDLILDSPIGALGFRFDAPRITAVEFLGTRRATRPPADPLARRVARAVEAYFERGIPLADLPVHFQGTTFQQRVWRALQKIPPGRTLTYGQLAQRLHTSPRAVGNACRANPVPLIVPCHRVVARSGLGGFAGRTDGPEVARKRWLLEHENPQ